MTPSFTPERQVHWDAALRISLLAAAIATSACNWLAPEPHTVTPAEPDPEPTTGARAATDTATETAEEGAEGSADAERGPIVEGALPPAAPGSQKKASSQKTATTARAKTKTPAKAKATAGTNAAKASAKAATSSAKASPAPAAPAPAPAAPKRVALPSTKHVRYLVGSGMQTLVNKDPRIVTWLKRITPVLDRCYRGLSGSPKGTVKVSVTMHENRRPSVGLKSLPGALAGMMPCATTKLMGTRAPLFTGPEGQKHTVSIQFK